MKRIGWLMIMLVAALPAFGQPLTAFEMLDIVKCKTNACAGAMILPKGYDVGNVSESEDYSLYEYYGQTSSPYDDNERVILPNRLEYGHTGKAYIISVSYYTGSKKDRDAILHDFGVRGFVVIEDTFSTFDNIQTEYMSARFPGMRLQATEYKKEGNEQRYTEYAFKLKWMPNPPRNELAAHKKMFWGE